MAMMQAVLLTAFEQPLIEKLVTRPVPSAGQVLVRIAASGVNPLDTKIVTGKATHARIVPPAILGIDLAGTVESVGPGVTNFKPGDDVYGMTGGVGGVQGSLAQFAAVDADLLARKPSNMSMREAAALPLAFITAWEGLVDRAKVSAGKTVLVHGGAGGVGHVVVQIAKAMGAIVFATGSSRQRAQIEGYGATFIDYNGAKVEEYVAKYTDGVGFDILYDCVGGAVLDESFQAAKMYTGHVVSCLGWGTHQLAPLSFRGATYSGVFTLLPLLTGKGRAHHSEIMRAATELVENGHVKVNLAPEHYTLSTVNEAHKAVATRSARGKVVVDIAV